MHRYSAASCGGGVSHSAVGAPSARETTRVDSLPSSNFPLNPRRQSSLTPYKLRCNKESLSSRLGPPDFYPQISDCPEETLTKEYLQIGYKENVDGIEEAREIVLTGIHSLTKPLVHKCKESIRKRLRAINESRAQKRKAGQIYGIPLFGQQLLRSGIFPEQRPCGEDFRKKWIESLSQPHKRLRSLADHVPHGYRRKTLLEVLIRYNVPLLRATWFVKVTYLNQVRPVSSGISSGSSDKTQLARSEMWTRDVIEYMQHLLDELLLKDGSLSNLNTKNYSQVSLAASKQQKIDSIISTPDVEEPALHFKWWYMVRLLKWHHAEGLLLSSILIEWVLNQLQDKGSLEVLPLLLPVIFDIIETITFSQTYVRSLVEVSLGFLRTLSLSGLESADTNDRHCIMTTLIEMFQYVLLSVPDIFVGLDCFPLPACFLAGGEVLGDVKLNDGAEVHTDFQKPNDAYQLSIVHVASAVQRQSYNLSVAVNPGMLGLDVPRIVQALDRVLASGDIHGLYNSLFDGLSIGGAEECWIEEVSPCLRASLKWIGTVDPSIICLVFLLCQWATCDFRDYRVSLPHDLKFTGTKDFSQVYVVVHLLKLKMEDMQNGLLSNKNSPFEHVNFPRGGNVSECTYGDSHIESVSLVINNDLQGIGGRSNLSLMFQSPGPLHDIVVCWLDQYQLSKGEGLIRLQILIMELIRFGIFCPQAYVRQLIVSGIFDRSGTLVDLARRKRHRRILKQLPASFLFEAFGEARIAKVPLPCDAVRIFSSERYLLLNRIFDGKSNQQRNSDTSVTDLPIKRKNRISAGKFAKGKVLVAELKAAISEVLHLPNANSVLMDLHRDTATGANSRKPLEAHGLTEGPPGNEECKKLVKQKLGDERHSPIEAFSPTLSDDEDTWWLRKGPIKHVEASFKLDQAKPNKHTSRGRQKMVRKTQSLAQLAAIRIEGSQGASTSHVCDSKISCTHRNGMDSEISRLLDGSRPGYSVSMIAKTLQQVRVLEKWSVTHWLVMSIRQLIEEGEKASLKAAESSGPFSPPVDDGKTVRWRLSEDELSLLLYLLDASSDMLSAIKLLLWLLPKAVINASSVVSGRNILILQRSMINDACEVTESFLLASIRRYEPMLLAADLLTEALSAAMQRTMAVVASNGRASSSAAFIYVRYLLRRYGSLPNVGKWEKDFKATCDQRLLTELDMVRALDSELGFSPIAIPAGVEDVDDYFRQKITSRISRAGPMMKEIVQRPFLEDAMYYFYGKEKKFFTSAGISSKGPLTDKASDRYHVAQQIVLGLIDCIRQNGGAAQDADASVVAAAVSAIVNNVASAIVKMPDYATVVSYPPTFSSNTSLLICVRRIVHIHIICLSLLKEALGDRLSRVFELALTLEALTLISGCFTPGKSQARNQFQLSPDFQDSNSVLSNECLNSSTKALLCRATKAAAAVSALVIGAIAHGITSLERMIACFKLKEGLDVLHFIRSVRSSSNGVSRTMSGYKVDSLIEVYLHWFRLLIGNSKMVCDGLVVELLGEPYMMAFSRMQSVVPLKAVFSPTYSIFAMIIWQPYILNGNLVSREDVHIYQSLSAVFIESVKHQPFRDIFLRDTHALYELMASDSSDSEFAAMLELHSADKHLKATAFVPSRARLFLSALLECKMLLPAYIQDDGSWIGSTGGSKIFAENEMKLLDQLVHVLDTLQPAKFHWQWVELRLLLNEQVLLEKIESNTPLVEAVRSLYPSSDNFVLSKNENNFTEIVLTRLLVRPDAASLYSEAVHLLGRSIEESLLQSAKWFLAGNDVLLGRKSIRQRLINIAQLRDLSVRPQFWKPWGWSCSSSDLSVNKGDKRKMDFTSLEEGEVVEEGSELKRSGVDPQVEFELLNSSHQFVTERALVDLILPCIDRSSSDSRISFANDLIKQMSTIEQQISLHTQGACKQIGMVSAGSDGSSTKGSTRKGTRIGSPGLGRRIVGASESSPTAVALQASLALRLQFLLRLLPVICSDREPSAPNMRHTLASVLLRLLGSRVVQEAVDTSPFYQQRRSYITKRERDIVTSEVASGNPSVDLSGDNLFDRLLFVLHGLLSIHRPSWMKPAKSLCKTSVKFSRDFSAFDREVAESLQAELDRMQLPDSIRRRIQVAMPMLPSPLRVPISCQSPSATAAVVSSVQSGFVFVGSTHGSQKNMPVSLLRAPPSISSAKGRVLATHDDLDVDPWLLLEDGTVSGSGSGAGSSNSNGDHTNLKALNWLRGAVRVRRMDLTYVGNADEDS